MSEINHELKWVPTKDELSTYINENNLFPINPYTIWFELLKLIRRVENIENKNLIEIAPFE